MQTISHTIEERYEMQLEIVEALLEEIKILEEKIVELESKK